MFLRTHLPKFAFALLALFLFVSISDAAECDPCVTAISASSTSVDRGEPSVPSNQGGDDDPCALCPFCLSPCIEPSPVTVSLEDRSQRFDLPESAMSYEAPSFPFLRPPRS